MEPVVAVKVAFESKLKKLLKDAIEIKHARFHLGVQLDGKVYMSLDSTVHERHGIRMYALDNNRLYVRLNDQHWLVPDSVTHSLKLETELESE